MENPDSEKRVTRSVVKLPSIVSILILAIILSLVASSRELMP